MKHLDGTSGYSRKLKLTSRSIAAVGGLVLIVSGITACSQGQDSGEQKSGESTQVESSKPMEAKRPGTEHSDKSYKVAPETGQTQGSPLVQDRQPSKKTAGTKSGKHALAEPEDKPGDDKARLSPEELK